MWAIMLSCLACKITQQKQAVWGSSECEDENTNCLPVSFDKKQAWLFRAFKGSRTSVPCRKVEHAVSSKPFLS